MNEWKEWRRKTKNVMLCLFTLEEVRWDCEYKSQCKHKNYFILRFNMHMEHSTRLKRCKLSYFHMDDPPGFLCIIPLLSVLWHMWYNSEIFFLPWRRLRMLTLALLIFHIVLKITNLVFWDKLIILVINKILIYRLCITIQGWHSNSGISCELTVKCQATLVLRMMMVVTLVWLTKQMTMTKMTTQFILNFTQSVEAHNMHKCSKTLMHVNSSGFLHRVCEYSTQWGGELNLLPSKICNLTRAQVSQWNWQEIDRSVHLDLTYSIGMHRCCTFLY